MHENTLYVLDLCILLVYKSTIVNIGEQEQRCSFKVGIILLLHNLHYSSSLSSYKLGLIHTDYYSVHSVGILL